MKRTFLIALGFIILAAGMNACKSNKTIENAVENAAATSPTGVNTDIVEKYWKLCEIFGTNIKDGTQPAKEPYITLKADGNRLVGCGGCNNYTGTYELKPGNRIKFSGVAVTSKMCINMDMDIETKLSQALEMADSYFLKEDTLILNRARMAPLARFEAVYLK
jgi:heat shock protein HslJ